jgi:hypothetical protein
MKWEEEHVGAALMSFGAKDSRQKAKEKNKVKEYDVIMDEEIEFVQALQMPGTITEKVGVLYYIILPFCGDKVKYCVHNFIVILKNTTNICMHFMLLTGT